MRRARAPWSARLAGWLAASLWLATPVALAGDLEKARWAVEAGDLGAAAMRLGALLEGRPDDREGRFLLARVRTWQGLHEESLALYRQLLEETPDNADYLLGKAQVRVWQGEGRAAVDLLERARGLAPDYLDVWRLEITTRERLADPAAPALRAQARERFPGEPLPEPPPPPRAAPTTEIGLAGRYERLSGPRAPWRRLQLDVVHRPREGTTVYAAAIASERFRRLDRAFQAGVYQDVGQGFVVQLEGGASPTHRSLARWTGMMQIQRVLGAGFVARLGGRRSLFADSRNDTLLLGVARYFGDYRIEYGANRSVLAGAPAAWSHVLRATWYYDGQGSALNLTLARGEEAEFVAPGVLRVRDASALALHGQHWFDSDLGLTWSLGRSRLDGAFVRDGIELGLRRRF